MSNPSRSSPLLTITGAVFALLGLALLGGGAYLASLSGSLYYVLAGIGLLAVGVLVFKGRRAAQGLLAVLLLATLIWSIVEVRFDWWQLLPRLDIWFGCRGLAAAAVREPAPGRGVEHRQGGIVCLCRRDGHWSASQHCSWTTMTCTAKCRPRTWPRLPRMTPPASRRTTGRHTDAQASATRYAPAAQITPANASAAEAGVELSHWRFQGAERPGRNRQ